MRGEGKILRRTGPLGHGLARGPDCIRETMNLIGDYPDQARGYQARRLRPRGLIAVARAKGSAGTDLGQCPGPTARERQHGGGVSLVRGAADPSEYLGL